MFMRALPIIQAQHPTVRVLIVGDNEGAMAVVTRLVVPLEK